MAEARRNRTNPSTLPRRNNGFEDRGGHQTPFASGVRGGRCNAGAASGYCTSPPRMQNAECRMQNDFADPPFLHSAFCILHLAAFALGAIVGSFLNVVIHRYPIEESVVFPPSHCPECRARIRWYDNVPILSYL